MQRTETSPPLVRELRPLIHRDSDRSFVKSYYHPKFADLDIRDAFPKTITPSPPAELFAAFAINPPSLDQALSRRRGRSY